MLASVGTHAIGQTWPSVTPQDQAWLFSYSRLQDLDVHGSVNTFYTAKLTGRVPGESPQSLSLAPCLDCIGSMPGYLTFKKLTHSSS